MSIDVGEFVGDFGAIKARLWSGAGDERGQQIEDGMFPMTRPSARHPDFYARSSAAYAAELSSFVDCIRRNAPSISVRTWAGKRFVANLAKNELAIRWTPIKLVRADGRNRDSC